jgi:oligopeptide/dipeptide ABC transporter ATP-binding protein
MYLGRVVELADAKDIYRDPLMPYTRALMSSIPVADPVVERKRERIILRGDVPSPLAPLSGCHFHTRCSFAIDDCSRTEPKLVELKPGHTAACIRISREHPHIEQNVANGLGSMTQ